MSSNESLWYDDHRNTSSSSPYGVMLPMQLMGVELYSFFLGFLVFLALIGLFCNVINIIVFTRIKSNDSINATLLGLAVSDSLICFTTVFSSLPHMPIFGKLFMQNLRWNSTEVSYIVFGVSHTAFARISIFLTALITLERCLCVTLPLRVKAIVTTRKVKGAVVLGYLLGISVMVKNYSQNRLAWKYYARLNTTLLGHVITDTFSDTNSWYTPLDVSFFFVILYLVIGICTFILITHLKEKMSWRETVTVSTSNDVSLKERRLVKMIVILSSIFMFCFFPNMAMFLMVMIDTRFTMQGSLIAVQVYVAYFTNLFEVINATMNLFVYYSNSTNYKEVFDKTFSQKELSGHLSSFAKKTLPKTKVERT